MAYEIRKMERNQSMASELLALNPDNSIVARKPLKILFPETWVGRDLAWIEGRIRVLTKCMVVCDNRYMVMNDCSHWPLDPDSINMTFVNGVSHYEFVFEAGSLVCPNTNVLIDEDILYSVFSEFIEKGRVPPYFSKDDVATLFLNSEYCTGRTLSASNSINEMVAGSITRVKGAERTEYRFVDKSKTDERVTPFAFIAFRSPIYMADTALTKMSTAYFKDGVTSALLTETTNIEPMERIARA